MTNTQGHGKRTDTASRVIAASPATLYRAFVEPKAVATWLPPAGMKGHIHSFEPRPGGTYRMTLAYERPEHSAAGKTSGNEDVVEGRFVELVPDERVVQRFEFESADPAFAGTMTMTWTLAPVAGGTQVTVTCANVPEGIRQEDHIQGLTSTLANLAEYTE
ncbi:SRPBCC family protein [Corallococcus macrosporus]|uniref:Aha1 domain-containing protein n=1 Tax=Myxococcus fulvus (strain ATCC BAA-855 / HW-1) TaxID=483219 RepID=F8CRU3_MYXFH|nr:SRPBCC family protein [Corallococcus macrosporus]AEI66841.1 Aha1 domain-containing protein [Corallococcus macrosporus]